MGVNKRTGIFNRVLRTYFKPSIQNNDGWTFIKLCHPHFRKERGKLPSNPVVAALFGASAKKRLNKNPPEKQINYTIK